MWELALSFGLWWIAVSVVLALLGVLRLAKINWGWLAVAVGVHALYLTANQIGLPGVNLEKHFGDLSWNWDGKAAAILLSVIAISTLCILRKEITLGSAGLTLKQANGSVIPATIVTLLMLASVIALEIAVSDGRQINIERLLFQATMPGIDEEIYFRGLLLLVLSTAVRGEGVSFLGAKINGAGLLVTMLFGLGHSLSWQDGAVQFSSIAFVYTAYLGFGLLWIRERTGSIVMAIAAHNLINFLSSFF